MIGTWQRLKARAASLVVQDCPPAVAACQVCRRAQCGSEQWLTCERRLAAERHLESGNGAAFEELSESKGECPGLAPDPSRP